MFLFRMKALPYYKMYPADAETDERFRSMTDTEKGFYWRCLNHCWINGSLPADPAERARALGNPQSYTDRMWERVGRCFVQKEDEPRMVNPRQEDERSKAISKSEKATSSIRTRYERRTNELIRALTRAESVSDSVSNSENKRNQEVASLWLSAGFEGPDNFDVWWRQVVENHPNKNRNTNAFMAIQELIIGGNFKRQEFEDGYSQLYESKKEDWTKEGGKYCTNLYDIVHDRLWKFKPAENDSWIQELVAEQALQGRTA